MATFSFFAGDDTNINNLGGSGLGFYGGSFGASVAVGAFQQTTFITNSNGTALGPQTNNIKWAHASSGTVDSSTSPISLISIPNNQATLNIRFTHNTSVQVQNVSALIYDRSNTASGAVGVDTYTAEIIHPGLTQVATGSGDTVWNYHPASPSGATSIILANSPGISGMYAGSGNSVRPDTVHDWFLAITCTPNSIGSKLFGLYTQCEYL